MAGQSRRSSSSRSFSGGTGETYQGASAKPFSIASDGVFAHQTVVARSCVFHATDYRLASPERQESPRTHSGTSTGSLATERRIRKTNGITAKAITLKSIKASR